MAAPLGWTLAETGVRTTTAASTHTPASGTSTSTKAEETLQTTSSSTEPYAG